MIRAKKKRLEQSDWVPLNALGFWLMRADPSLIDIDHKKQFCKESFFWPGYIQLLNYDLTPTKKAQELAFVVEHNIEGALGVFFIDAMEADCKNIIETWTKLGPQKQKMSLETIMTKVLMSLGYGQTMG